MYKVFIAEDEIVVREGLRNSIQAGSGPFVLVGEASDGEMALSIMKDVKPDILITDIRMPFVDGLSLSRIIKKILPWKKKNNRFFGNYNVIWWRLNSILFSNQYIKVN